MTSRPESQDPKLKPTDSTAAGSISEQMLPVFVHTALGGAGFTSLLSAVSHYLMEGVSPIVPAIEFSQFIVVAALWAFALKSGSYRAVFPMQLIAAYAGMSLVLMLGGDNFLSNCFWISLIAPMCIAANYPRIGKALFAISIAEIITYHNLYADEKNSQTSILTMDALLFTVAMLAFVLVIKNWYGRLEKHSLESQREVQRLKDEKLKYLVHLNHEIRNPMAAIVTGIELLQEVKDSDPRNGRQTSERIDYLVKSLGSTSTQVLSVLNDALELERIESTKDTMTATTFSVRMLLSEIEESHSVAANAHGSSIKVEVAHGLHDEWVGKRSRIAQVMTNLTSNAVRHAKAGLVTLSVSERNGQLNFSVADTGMGMSELALKHVYDPFSASMGDDGAIGLGLAICKSIVENQLDGEIAVTSTEGKGTTFSFAIPLDKALHPALNEDQGELRAAKGPFDAKALKGKTVLVVDDNKINNEMVGMLLGNAGLVVDYAHTSQEATARLSAGMKYDFAVIDHNLGQSSEQNGVNLTVRLLAAGVAQVVGLTGNVSAELEQAWLKAGAKKVLYKPVRKKDLIGVLSGAN